MSSITISAEELKQKNPSIAGVNAEVKRLGLNITLDIRAAHKAKQKHLVIELPVIFIIPGLSPEEARLCVYSRLITDLTTKGFDVRLKDKWLRIQWGSNLPTDETKRMQRVLAEVSKPRAST